MKGKTLIISRKIEISANDDRRCSWGCQFAEKTAGLYRCVLFGQIIDTGRFEDTPDEYGFERCRECIEQAKEER